MTTYGTEVNDGIRDAFARGMRPSVVRDKLRAGTLPGLDGPCGMAERTFRYRWSQAKREQEEGRREGSASSGPGLLERVELHLQCTELGLDIDSDDPEAIAQATGHPLSYVRGCIEYTNEPPRPGLRMRHG